MHTSRSFVLCESGVKAERDLATKPYMFKVSPKCCFVFIKKCYKVAILLILKFK